MADEELAIAESEPAAEPTIAAEQETPELPQTILEPGEEAAADDSGEAEAEAVEYVTVERNGKSYQVPKALEGEFLMQADYTRKRQADAEVERALQEREQRIEQQAKATEEELDQRATLRSLDMTLAEYAKLTPADWAQHESLDPLATQRAWREFQMLQAQRGEVAKTLETKQAERSQKAAQSLATRVEETLTFAKKEIPNFKPEMIGQMVETATRLGVPEDAIKANWSPTFLKLLQCAQIGEQVLKQQSAPKTAIPKPTIAPLATVKAASSTAPSRSLADLAKGDDMEAYAAARNAGRKR